MNRLTRTVALLAMAAGFSLTAQAVTLEEYGVELTSSGLVDHTTGLRWLDSGISFGTIDTIDGYLANGWRVATTDDLQQLLTRGIPSNEDGPNNPLDYADFLDMIQAIGIGGPGIEGPAAPWVCFAIYADTGCSSTETFSFTRVILTVDPGVPGLGTPGSDVSFITFLTEVPLFGNFFDGVCEDCTGRALLVRNVPLPAAVWLLLSALGGLLLNRRT